MNTDKENKYNLRIFTWDINHRLFEFSSDSNTSPFDAKITISQMDTNIETKDVTYPEEELVFYKNEKEIARQKGIFSENGIIKWVNNLIKADKNLN